MAATIRLMRFGNPKAPFYRIVVLDKRKKRDGAYIEKIGTYNPMVSPAEVLVSKSKLELWKSRGAQFSEGASKLLSRTKHITFQD